MPIVVKPYPLPSHPIPGPTPPTGADIDYDYEHEHEFSQAAADNRQPTTSRLKALSQIRLATPWVPGDAFLYFVILSR